MVGEPDSAAGRLQAALISYGETGDAGDLDRAVRLSDGLTQLEAFRDLSGEAAAVVWALGGAARIHRSHLSDDPRDLDDAIAWCGRALDAAPEGDPNRPAYASNLATILVERYEHDRGGADLDAALALFDWAVPAIESAGGQAAVALHGQGQALLALYQAGHDAAALDRAIEVLRKAVADATQPPVVTGGYLTTLGQALCTRAQAASDPVALDEAVNILRRACDWTDGADDHVVALASLGNALLDRSEIGQPVHDLEQSASCLEQAMSLAAPGTPDWGRLASNLGNALIALFRATGRRDALLRARGLFQDAARALADPQEHAACLSNLAACLEELHEQTGDNSFLDEAIGVFRATVGDLTRPAVPQRRQNFGICLLARFKRYQSLADLDQAIAQFEAAARDSPPDSVIHAAATNSLGNALSLRFELLDHDDDLAAAASAYEEAVRSARESSLDRAIYRANWGVSLMRRGQRSQSAGDLDAAIAQQEIAAAGVPQASQEYIRVLAGLADSLAVRATATGGPGGQDADRARQAYQATTMAALERLPEQAIGSSLSWGAWATARQSFAEAAEALGYGLQALDQLFRVQLTRLQKETWLRDSQAIPVLAAYALARAGDPAGAATALEQGRGLLLSEALQRDHAELGRLAELGRVDLQERYDAAVSRWNQLSRGSA
jgi:tetratricopeptide (TPR) repeat protein